MGWHPVFAQVCPRGQMFVMPEFCTHALLTKLKPEAQFEHVPVAYTKSIQLGTFFKQTFPNKYWPSVQV